MKKKLVFLILSASMLLAMAAPALALVSDGTEDDVINAVTELAEEPKEVLADGSYTNVVYLGIEGYGTETSSNKNDFVHRFYVNGVVKTAKVSFADGYPLQNLLAEGYVYNITAVNGVVTVVSASSGVEGIASAVTADSITVDGSTVTLKENVKAYAINPQIGGAVVTPIELASVNGKTVKVYGNPVEVVYQAFVAEPYTSPVSGTPGLRTVKNYLATALEPVGTSLYVYGGAWDWQDKASSFQARTIGVPQTWIDFFQQQNANFSYRDNNNHAESTYPFGFWNQYYYAGVDCSGYVGWSVYNVMNMVSGGPDTSYYVGKANTRAKNLSAAGFGTYTRKFTAADFKPGDIMSMSGHCWICLGTCEDGSIVIVHSTPSDSKNGHGGGGVQISGISNTPNSQAYRLAKYYMEKYFPEWSSRYDVVQYGMSYITNISNYNNGKFSWHNNVSGLTDPDGYLNKNAAEILKDLFQDDGNLDGQNP